MKKALSLVLALLMVLSMTACGSSGTETPSAAPAARQARVRGSLIYQRILLTASAWPEPIKACQS